MKSKNELIYYVRQIIGKEGIDGFYTTVFDENEKIKVPNFLFKDGNAIYPEIRITPFVRDEEVSHQIKVRSFNRNDKVRHYKAVFQIDIYATNIVLANKIYDAVNNRIDLFDEYDILRYGYNPSFQQIDDNLYYTNMYNTKNFNIFRILINNNIIRKVDSLDLLEDNTYIINEDGLHIQTTLPIEKVHILNILSGLLFSNGHTAYEENIINLTISKKKMLSELEKNNVERISFDLNILYNMTQKRNPGPIFEDMSIE